MTTENSETPAAARKRLSCPERDSFANPFPCPQGGFGDFRGEIGFLRPVSWDAFRRFVRLSKINHPEGFGTGRQLGSPRRWRPHVPSPTAGKNAILGNAFPLRHDSDIDFVLCLQAYRKSLTFFSACENDRRGIPTAFHFR